MRSPYFAEVTANLTQYLREKLGKQRKQWKRTEFPFACHSPEGPRPLHLHHIHFSQCRQLVSIWMLWPSPGDGAADLRDAATDAALRASSSPYPAVLPLSSHRLTLPQQQHRQKMYAIPELRSELDAALNHLHVRLLEWFVKTPLGCTPKGSLQPVQNVCSCTRWRAG